MEFRKSFRITMQKWELYYQKSCKCSWILSHTTCCAELPPISEHAFSFLRVHECVSKFNILIHEENVKIREEAEHQILWLAGIALRTRPSSSSSPSSSLSLSPSYRSQFRRYVSAGFVSNSPVSVSLSLSLTPTRAHTHTQTTPDKEGFSAGHSASTERPLLWWWNYEDASLFTEYNWIKEQLSSGIALQGWLPPSFYSKNYSII